MLCFWGFVFAFLQLYLSTARQLTSTSVSTETELNAAITSGNTIEFVENIFLSNPVNIFGVYYLTIEGGGYALDGSNIVQCFVFSYASVSINNLTISNGYSTSYGGGILISANAAVSASNCRFVNCFAGIAGGGVLLNYGTATFINCDISNNIAVGYGGGIEVYNPGASANFIDCDIHDNYAYDSGGGLMVTDGASATFSACSVYDNTAANYGGGVFVYTGSEVEVTSSEVYGNDADSGGGVMVTEGSADITNCALFANHAYDSGGGLMVTDGTSATFSACSVYDNTAVNYGGGVFVYTGSEVEMTSSEVYGNDANSGGGVMVSEGSADITNCALFANHAAEYGGGVLSFETGSYVTLMHSKVYANNAGVSGGGLGASVNASLIVTNSFISQNLAHACGGMVGQDHGTHVSLHNSQFLNNTAVHFGAGACFADLEFALVVNCSFTDNFVGYFGGGVAINGTVFIGNSTFFNNTAVYGGAVGFYSGSEATITQTLLYDNIAELGGALSLFSAFIVRISNCDISNNVAMSAGGIHVFSGSTITVTNCTICANVAIKLFGGGIFVFTNSFLTMMNTTIAFNTAGYYGGGMLIANQSEAILINNSFNSNSAEIGGGLFFQKSIFQIVNCSCAHNRVISHGGGLAIANSLGKISHFSAIHNYAESSGAGVVVYKLKSWISFVNCVIKCNEAVIFGGGIASQEGDVQIINSVISDNTAGLLGGGVYGVTAVFDITSTLIANNNAFAGGAMGISIGNVVILNSEMTNNQAQNGGGAYIYSSTGIIDNCQIMNNLATQFGGGLYTYSSKIKILIYKLSLMISNSIISENEANSKGGGLYAYIGGNSSVCLDKTNVFNNTATYGGGIYLKSGELNIIDAFIDYNHAQSGSFVLNNTKGGCTITEGCIQSRNFPYNYYFTDKCEFIATRDGTLHVQTFFIGGDVLMVGNETYEGDIGPDDVVISAGEILLFENKDLAQQEGFDICYAGAIGGGFYVEGGELIVTNGKIFENNALKYGGGIYAAGGSCVFYDTILDSNYASINAEIYFSGGTFGATNFTMTSQDLNAIAGDSSQTAACSSSCLPGQYGNCFYFSNALNCPVNCVCADCPAGTSSAVEGSTTIDDCENCDAGKFSEIAATECTSCAAGRYATTNVSDTGGGLVTQVFSAATVCNECPAGYYAPATATLVCRACNAGTVSDSGASSCSGCPAGWYSGNGEAVCLPCEAGKYGSGSELSSCSSCDPLLTSSVASSECDLAIEHYYVRDSISWPCPSNADCPGGSSLPLPRKHYWTDRSEANNLKDVYRCSRDTCIGAVESACWTIPGLNNASCSDDLLCREGSHGPLCGSCINKFVFSVAGQQCVKCSSNVQWTIFFAVLAVGGMLLLVLFYLGIISLPYSVLTSWAFAMIKLLSKNGSLKVLFVTYQIIQSIAYSMDIVYPQPFAAFVQFFQILSFDLPVLECAGFDLYEKVYILSSIPVLIAFLIIVVGFCRLLVVDAIIVWKKQHHHSHHELKTLEMRRKIKSQHAWSLLLLSYLVLPPITSAQLRALDCVPITDQSRVLRVDTAFNCDTKAHKQFQMINFFLICCYLAIPLIWLMLLWLKRKDLFPLGLVDDQLIVERRKIGSSLGYLHFLFNSYRPHLAYWEIFEMFRRILFIGIIPLLVSTTLKRALIGLVFSFASIVIYRELAPFLSDFTNRLACLAQLVIFLTYGGSLLIELDISGTKSFSFALILFGINFSVIAVALGASYLKARYEHEVMRLKREQRVTHIEWACNFTTNKFETTFAVLNQTVVSSSQALFLCYGSLQQVKSMLYSGIPIRKTSDEKLSGVVFTLHLPSQLTDFEKQMFDNNIEAFVVCSLPRRVMSSLSHLGVGHCSSLWLLPRELLQAMRGSFFDDLADPTPWKAGQTILPPQCIKRAYQIDNNACDSPVSSNPLNRSFRTQIQSLNETNEDDIEMTMFENPIPLRDRCGSVDNDQNITDSDNGVDDVTFKTVVLHKSLNFEDKLSKYLSTMINIRNFCANQKLIPLYHYTQSEIVPLIVKSGFRMSTQGQGDGGVYFSTLGPASYGFGSDDYEENIIIDCFGKERLEEYLGQGKLDVCMVYAVDPLMVEQASGGRDNALVVCKEYFQVFSLQHSSGSYFLRSDRLLGVFHLGNSRVLPTSIIPEVSLGLASETDHDREIQTKVKQCGVDRQQKETTISSKIRDIEADFFRRHPKRSSIIQNQNTPRNSGRRSRNLSVVSMIEGLLGSTRHSTMTIPDHETARDEGDATTLSSHLVAL